jgi:hypothetical protein
MGADAGGIMAGHGRIGNMWRRISWRTDRFH